MRSLCFSLTCITPFALVSDNDIATKAQAEPWRLLKSRGVIHNADLDVVHSDTAEGWRMSMRFLR